MSSRIVRFPHPFFGRAVDPFDTFFRDAERTLDDRADGAEKSERVVHPAAHLAEVETGVELRIDLPGVSAETLTLEVEQDRLTIVGTRDDARGIVRFERTFRVGPALDVEAVSATLENGVLVVQIAKRASAVKRRVEIKAA